MTAGAIPAPAEPEPVPVAQDAAPVAPASEAAAVAPSRRGRQRRLSWKIPVTVVLLGLLGAAVIVVLLQSAGVIHWSFLGPVA